MHLFAVTKFNVVRVYHKYKGVWSAPIDEAELFCEREPRTR